MSVIVVGVGVGVGVGIGIVAAATAAVDDGIFVISGHENGHSMFYRICFVQNRN